MTENEANIYSIAYRDCKEVTDSIDVNEEHGKASTILFYMDEILEALKIASELQAIGTIEEFKALKEKSVAKKPQNIDEECGAFDCPACGHTLIALDDMTIHQNCLLCGQKLDWSEE